ncbi:IS1595 family transposase [Gemmobacter sp.]|uniref:IS1595 family transposase n=1 Tax=Gemmobacter sp. TaxID=1898957 RepID=UPI002AFDD3AC|nr:IS1595 family transposase [Gemmobacter sp.]
MAQKNAYLFRGRISERKFRDLLRLFAVDITADRAAVLTGLSHNTAAALDRLLRDRMAELAQDSCPFRGQVEIDESCFGPSRTHGHRGRGNPRKVPVFGILERGGRVHCQIVQNCSRSTLHAIIAGRVHLSAEVTTDGFRSYDGLVEAGFLRHHRINKYADPDHPVFSENGVHINGIESFWSYAKRRHQKFNGLRRSSFPAFLKETEFRFNTRDQNLYKTLLRSCRMKPLRQ